MGQILMKDSFVIKLKSLSNKLINEAYEVEQVVNLSYEGLIDCVTFLNQISESLGDITGKKLAFVIAQEPEENKNWRHSMKIKCYKVSCSTGVIQSTYLLRMKDFVHIYNEMTGRAASLSREVQKAVDDSKLECLDASMILNEFNNLMVPNSVQEMDECSICMDRKATNILTCMHIFCEQCIDSWQKTHGTCPTCRTPIYRPQDAWILSEAPTEAEMALDTNDYALSLIDRHIPVDNAD